LKVVIQQIESTGAFAPWGFLLIFLAAALLMIWRLEAMSADGFEGTVLGTLIMPYCSGLGNLIFAFLLARQNGPGAEVMTNALVNNVTNLTLLIGLPALLWQAGGKSGKTKSKKAAASRWSMVFTLVAVLFFTGATWALGRDGKITFNDGLVLVGLFLFWQCFHIFEVLQGHVSGGKVPVWLTAGNLVLLGAGAYASYVSIAWLVDWLNARPAGFISKNNLGLLSGWLMVLPNALLALYYGWRRRPEVVYTSQVGDAHICLPLAIGIFALHHPMELPAQFQTGIYLILGATLLHGLCLLTTGKLPRLAGLILVGAYAGFLKLGWL
jgi:cation:H+ antiporter